MLSRIALYITDYLIEGEAIKSEDRELYHYGFEMGMAQIINTVSTLLIGLLFRQALESLLFFACFMTLRSYTGGYHSPSHLKCYILSTSILIVVLAAGHFIALVGWEFFGIILGVFGAALLYRLAPVDDENKPLDEIEKVVFRKRAMRNLLIWSCIAVILLFTPFQSFSVILCLCFFVMGISAFLG